MNAKDESMGKYVGRQVGIYKEEGRNQERGLAA